MRNHGVVHCLQVFGRRDPEKCDSRRDIAPLVEVAGVVVNAKPTYVDIQLSWDCTFGVWDVKIKHAKRASAATRRYEQVRRGNSCAHNAHTTDHASMSKMLHMAWTYRVRRQRRFPGPLLYAALERSDREVEYMDTRSVCGRGMQAGSARVRGHGEAASRSGQW